MANQNIIKVQKRLTVLGYNVGPLDGIRGRRVIIAVKQFQHNNGLRADGLVGRNTYAALFAQPKKIAEQPSIDFDAYPWMAEAFRVKGLHEKRDHKTLWNWLRSDGATVGDPSKIPWCGDFTQTAVLLSMPDEPMIENPYLAANWTKFGNSITPTYGAVMSFWRGSPSSWKGHVAFLTGINQDKTAYRILGGNQGNAVTETWISTDRLRSNGCRWPSTALPTKGNIPVLNSKGAVLSTNEA
jgi:uncharacterized protein (TIGR02594 family)